MLDQVSGLVGLQLASAFAGGSAGSSTGNNPHVLLDRYIPGFGAIHGLILERTGIDITTIVARCAIVLGVYTVSKVNSLSNPPRVYNSANRGIFKARAELS